MSLRNLGETDPLSVTSAKRLEAVVFKVFRAHWRAVSTDLSKGVDVAKDRVDRFFAAGSRQRLRMAQAYYGHARAAEFARASDNEVRRLLSPWLGPFRRDVIIENLRRERLPKKFVS